MNQILEIFTQNAMKSLWYFKYIRGMGSADVKKIYESNHCVHQYELVVSIGLYKAIRCLLSLSLPSPPH
jgi:hypothetical protein